MAKAREFFRATDVAGHGPARPGTGWRVGRLVKRDEAEAAEAYEASRA
jgi:hypothetical protein